MCKTGSVFDPSERKNFSAGATAFKSCGKIGTNGALGSATNENDPFCEGFLWFLQAERAAEPPRGMGIGGGNPSEPPCEPYPLGGGAACASPRSDPRSPLRGSGGS